jgi:hypothetical protein
VAGAATVHAKGTYRAYSAWDDWKWWQPDKCTETQPFFVSEPAATGQYPVVVYLHSMLADWVQNVEGQRFADAAAQQGFVVAAVSYDSWMATSALSVDGNAKCVFDAGSRGNALAMICARPKADCSKGVLVTGFSIGGAVAARARNASAQVRAAWLIGVSGPLVPEALAAPEGTRALPDDRLRITLGRSDVEVRSPTTGQVTGIDLTGLNGLTGQHCSASPCLRANGSGYVVVGHDEVADGVADHCFWLDATPATPANSCTGKPPAFDPGFRAPSTNAWSLITNLTWLRAQLG